MLIPTFRISLNRPMLAGLATVGKFDGQHPSIACATSSDNVLVHSPHDRDEANEDEIKQLSVQQTITALTCGDMEAMLEGDEDQRDIILVGTAANLLAYDIENNSDVFFKDMDEGCSSILYGKLPNIDQPLAIVGGPCSLYGFDADGMEQFWTVTGDRVSSLALRDVAADHKVELLVGSEDFAIRMYSGEEVLNEIMEGDVITGLTTIQDDHFGFALANHTIGVYDNITRIWHAKCKHNATCINAFDLDSDGQNEIIAGWSNGRMEVRKADSGALVYKDTFANSVAALLKSDYRLDGREQIIACATDGQIRAYSPADPDQQGSLMEVTTQEKEIQDLYAQKQALATELANLESSMKAAKSGSAASAGALSCDTTLAHGVKVDPVNGCWAVDLTPSAPTAVIKLVIIFSEQLFEGESKVIYPESPASTMSLELKPKKKSGEVVAKLQVVVGMSGSQQDHVFDKYIKLPRFAAFAFTPKGRIPAMPTSKVVFNIEGALKNRVVLWLQRHFLFESELDEQGRPSVLMDMPNLDVSFISLLDGSILNFSLAPNSITTIRCDDMELVGDVVQDLCAWLQLTNVASTAEFPAEMKEFEQVLALVLKHDAQRVKLATSMADSSNVIKTLVIKAEESRMLGDMKSMSQHYMELYKLNKELLGTYTERADNHQQLLSNLKLVNYMIQKAAKLRCGKHKTMVVSACRDAIRTNNVTSLKDIFRLGHSNG